MNDISRGEKKIADLVFEGLSNREIAAKLEISEKTVKFHLTNIFRKTGLKSRSLLIAEYYKEKLGIGNISTTTGSDSAPAPAPDQSAGW